MAEEHAAWHLPKIPGWGYLVPGHFKDQLLLHQPYSLKGKTSTEEKLTKYKEESVNIPYLKLQQYIPHVPHQRLKAGWEGRVEFWHNKGMEWGKLSTQIIQ